MTRVLIPKVQNSCQASDTLSSALQYLPVKFWLSEWLTRGMGSLLVIDVSVCAGPVAQKHLNHWLLRANFGRVNPRSSSTPMASPTTTPNTKATTFFRHRDRHGISFVFRSSRVPDNDSSGAGPSILDMVSVHASAPSLGLLISFTKVSQAYRHLTNVP